MRASKIYTVPNGVDSEYFDPAIAPPAPYDAALPTFAFTGTVDYLPNIEAVTWFATGFCRRSAGPSRTPNSILWARIPRPPSASSNGSMASTHRTGSGRAAATRSTLVAAVAPMRVARGNPE